MAGARRPRFEVILRPEAAGDIERIYEFIAQDSPQNAAAVAERLLAAMGSLRDFPRRGRRAPESKELGIELRQVVVSSFRVLYMLRGAEVHVLTVRHTARDRWRGRTG